MLTIIVIWFVAASVAALVIGKLIHFANSSLEWPTYSRCYLEQYARDRARCGLPTLDDPAEIIKSIEAEAHWKAGEHTRIDSVEVVWFDQEKPIRYL